MLALLLLIIWPIAEFFVALKVAEAIGVLLTVILLLVSWPVGLWLMKAEGRAAWARLRIATAQGRPPGGEVVGGALIVLGGALLIVPGFISDILGLCLLVPPVRRLAGTGLARNLQSRLVVAVTRFAPPPGSAPSGTAPGASGSAYDVESTATDIDGPQLQR
jgi:UPF0716 protein FxsA